MANKLREPEMILAIVGLIVGILPLVIFDRTALRLIGFGIAVVLLGAAAILALRKGDHFDADAAVVSLTLEEASKDDIAWIADRQRQCFGKAAVPFDVLMEWFASSPKSFTIVRHAANRIGFIDLLPIKEPALDLFVRGIIDECGIRGVSLYTENERAKVETVYIESVAVGGENKRVHVAGVTKLLEEFENLLGKVADPANVKYICGLGATLSGRGFMEKRGFELASSRKARRDRLPLYRIAYSALRKRLSES